MCRNCWRVSFRKTCQFSIWLKFSSFEGVSPLETLKRLRGCVEFRDKELMLKEIYAVRAEGNNVCL
jgi:hypothetical protein